MAPLCKFMYRIEKHLHLHFPETLTRSQVIMNRNHTAIHPSTAFSQTNFPQTNEPHLWHPPPSTIAIKEPKGFPPPTIKYCILYGSTPPLSYYLSYQRKQAEQVLEKRSSSSSNSNSKSTWDHVVQQLYCYYYDSSHPESGGCTNVYVG